MAEKQIPYMTALDAIATEGEHIQMIKAAIPYIQSERQSSLSIYLKYLELRNTITFFHNSNKSDMQACSLSAEESSPLDMLNDIKNYCNEEEQDSINNIIQAFQGYQMYQTYKETMKTEGTEGTNPLDLMKSFLSPEQSSMLDTYSMLFNN